MLCAILLSNMAVRSTFTHTFSILHSVARQLLVNVRMGVARQIASCSSVTASWHGVAATACMSMHMKAFGVDCVHCKVALCEPFLGEAAVRDGRRELKI